MGKFETIIKARQKLCEATVPVYPTDQNNQAKQPTGQPATNAQQPTGQPATNTQQPTGQPATNAQQPAAQQTSSAQQPAAQQTTPTTQAQATPIELSAEIQSRIAKNPNPYVAFANGQTNVSGDPEVDKLGEAGRDATRNYLAKLGQKAPATVA